MKFNLLFFIRILLRHLGLLFLVPILLSSMVMLLTVDQPKVYDSKTRIYTAFASGSTIELNNTKFDYSKTNIAYDNLMNLIRSRATLETVSLKLFSQHMMLDSFNINILSERKFNELHEIVPEEVKALVDKDDFDTTFQNFLEYKESSHDNFINELLNLEHPDYSVSEILGKIGVRRISISDFVDISYQSEDPAICQSTLIILAETFIAANAEIKANQSDAVVKYFENQLAVNTKQLERAELDLLEFNRENKLMNYYEQTKQLAMRRENFELRYQNALQRNVGAKAVLKSLEKKMRIHDKKRLQSKEVLKIRDEISKLKFKKLKNEIRLNPESNVQIDTVKSLQLQEEILKLENELRFSMDTIYSVDFDKRGMATSDVLTEYLAAIVEYDGSTSELKALDQMRIDFDELYTWYAPLGATMKKLERKINIEEQEYLSLLNNLGLAKLRQQNMELQSNLKITEPAIFPIKPNPSKRMMLVIVAGVVGFLIVVMTLFVLEFLDGNLNTAERAEDKIGLKVSSIFPAITKNPKNIDYDYLTNKAVNAISRNIILNQFKKGKDGMPLVNLIFSTDEAEGKSFICKQVIHKFCELGYSTLHITYDEEDFGANINCYQKVKYEVSDKLYKISELPEFDVYSTITDYSLFDFILLEIPGIIRNPFPVKLASIMDYSFLVTRANRAWSDADANALSLFKEATSGPEPTVILNGVKVLEMETVIGEIPKKRSRFRRWVKRLFQLRFFTKKTIV